MHDKNVVAARNLDLAFCFMVITGESSVTLRIFEVTSLQVLFRVLCVADRNGSLN
jgi:hypothetical protein